MTLSLVLLPPNTRTYGNATNENRFGLWSLAGHYTAIKEILDKTGVHADPGNERVMAAYRKLGLLDFGAAHTIGRNFAKWNLGQGPDPESQRKAIEAEVANITGIAQRQSAPLYFYGGEWGIGSDVAEHGPWPLYTGQGDRPLNETVRKAAEIQVKIFTAVGKAIRQRCPQAKLCLQWGAPAVSLAHLRAGMPKDLVDGFGMDAPMFELLPEISNALGSINALWMLRAEARRLGWPRLPVLWCEGPFFPTTPGCSRNATKWITRSVISCWALPMAWTSSCRASSRKMLGIITGPSITGLESSTDSRWIHPSQQSLLWRQ